jgi:hypothetical protein
MMRRCALSFILVLLLVPRFASAEDAPAAFLGMAVAESITEGDDGLTSLSGVHNALWSNTVPVSEDLQIYTRWLGTGTHSVKIVIVDPATDTQLAQTADSVDFGHDPVTFFTHDFTGTSFPDSGVYDIQVSLDDRRAADYGFFVNGADQLPSEPAFVVSVPAESGSVDSRGNASITGIFEYFSFDSFPADDSFSIVTLLFSGFGDYTHYVAISDPDGIVVATSRSTTFTAGFGEMNVLTDTFDTLSFKNAGTYSAAFYLNGALMMSTPLVITTH